jgi:hypothetical protein
LTLSGGVDTVLPHSCQRRCRHEDSERPATHLAEISTGECLRAVIVDSASGPIASGMQMRGANGPVELVGRYGEELVGRIWKSVSE